MSRNRNKAKQQSCKAAPSASGQEQTNPTEGFYRPQADAAPGSQDAQEAEVPGTDDQQTKRELGPDKGFGMLMRPGKGGGSTFKRLWQCWKRKLKLQSEVRAGEGVGQVSLKKALLAILATFVLLGLAIFLVTGQFSSPPQTAGDADQGAFSSEAPEQTPEPTEKISVIEEPVPPPAAVPVIEPTPEPGYPAPNYKMAYMGQEEAESPNEDGLDETLYRLNSTSFKDVSFYAIAFAVELGAENGQELLGIRVEDAASGAYLSATPYTALHVYKSVIPTEEHLSAHPWPDVPAKSVAAASYVAACTFVSLEKYSYEDINIILTYRDVDGEHECWLKVNASMDDISMPVSYTVGNGLVKLGSHYYVIDDRNGTGSSESSVYYFRDIRCVSRPLLGHMTGLEQGVDVRLMDDKSGQFVEFPAGLDLFLHEESVGFPNVSTISIGVSSAKGTAMASSVLAVSSPCVRLGHDFILL